MRTRRRAPKVVWLPTTNQFESAAGLNAQELVHTFSGAAVKGDEIASASPLTFDQPELGLANSSLADLESSGYRLRRIVGKIYCVCDQKAVNMSGQYLVTAGFMVKRAAPNGAAVATGSPAIQSDIRDPWIWRRTWIIGNGATTNPVTKFADSANFSNFEGGPGTYDGPHVDQKTARIVSEEERLFLVLSTVALEAATSGTEEVTYLYDLRILASMRTNSGNRRNASR